MVEVANSDYFHLVDDFYFLALHDDEEVFPISDEKYALELQLQEALMSSAISSRVPNGSRVSQTCQHFNSRETHKGKEKEIGGSSNSQTHGRLCLICMEVKAIGEMFISNTCTHLFCTDCIGKHIGAKIQQNISLVKCPDLNCKGVIEPQFCRSVVPGEVFDRWEKALCESLILGSQKFYCPFQDCSAMLVDDGGPDVVESECPNCHKLFCAKCKVAWHAGISCCEFQNLSKDERSKEDIMMMDLAKNSKWRRCPNCKIFVEKIEGCLHISCRCGIHFCYGCGSLWNETHQCG
ncbi:E3 ubiquitin-protein ligase RNF144B [Durio zibethinus]|uniref:RBR-type E3 ubiquitin transferase n=1 Tax=Durio zibethinus TaxID=66656 RepID=A0A6P5WXF3_DURZI|nr:E3 ubiquitin-protein ligase RNF144B [Durio zibethinus]